MSLITYVLYHKDSLCKFCSVGKANHSTLPARVVDTMSQDVPPSDVSEIIYQRPSQMMDYWCAVEAATAAFEGGWFYSGDFVGID